MSSYHRWSRVNAFAKFGVVFMLVSLLILTADVLVGLKVATPIGSFFGVAAEAADRSQARQLSFTERVAYQRKIEEVYWRHRIWPKENPDPKPALTEVMSDAEIQQEVDDYLRNSQALEDHWQQPLTAEQLQAEMNRMAQNTHQPEVLREILAALGNDPFVIAECLARPLLAERLARKSYAGDEKLHADLKRRAESELLMNRSVKEMKLTSGVYSEMVWIKSDENEPAESNQKNPGTVRMSASEWDESTEDLAAIFGSAENGKARAPGAPTARIKAGVLSGLQEDDSHYYATAVLEKGEDRLKVATVGWQKEPFESWSARTGTRSSLTPEPPAADYYLPAITGLDADDPAGFCADDTWTPTSTGANVPAARRFETSVWTGTEMIVWGGWNGSGFFSSGGRYNPTSDSWTTTSTGANTPSPRRQHTAIWTGTEMIVWGGENDSTFFTSGGRYNPGTNSWVVTNATGAPSIDGHTAVWTGFEMIVWGNWADFPCPILTVGRGGRYSPSSNTWTSLPCSGAPLTRTEHTAVWTGTEMIVWGGRSSLGPNYEQLNSGGRYDPSSDTWTATSTGANLPSARGDHSAVWTGTRMIVWGGNNDLDGYFNTGGRYNPSNDTWATTSTGANVPSARAVHSAVWTGHEMIVWGGYNGSSYRSTGGRYDPGTNSWVATSTTTTAARSLHRAVWTGSEMIVWGGWDGSVNFNTGGRYCAQPPPTCTADDVWAATNTTGAPSFRASHAMVWTGTEMVVWGGTNAPGTGYLNTGGKYNASVDAWTATAATSLTARANVKAVWSGVAMLIWGGSATSGTFFNTGSRYFPATNTWLMMTTTNAPAGRRAHSAVWSGSEMIVWGGENGSDLNTGGRYNPISNIWTATSTAAGVPSARQGFGAVWTGSKMVVWGGHDGVSTVNTGGIYDPVSNSWTATSTANAPAARTTDNAVWTGNEIIVWGGHDGTNSVNTGGRYDPGANTWMPTSTVNAPSARSLSTNVWTGSEMIVWGGAGSSSYMNTGGRYDPSNDSWATTTTANAPDGRNGHRSIWADDKMIVWGGVGNIGYLSTGGLYCAIYTTPTSTPTATPTNPATGTPSDTPTDTPTPADTPSITGVVSYANAAAPPKFISGATVCASGSPTVCTTTDPEGQYVLTGMGAGPYTLSVAKSDQVNGISSNDCARIAQHVAGISTLTTNIQRISADVSGNDAVSSNDAAKIAQFVAGVTPLPLPNLSGGWTFFVPGPTFPIGVSPTTYIYPSVTGPLTGQDFWGVLRGDVTGNWNPSGALPANGLGTAEIMTYLPSVSTPAGKEIVVPINVQSVVGNDVISYEFDLKYDPAVIQPLPNAADGRDTASRSLSIMTNASDPGLLRVVVYGAYPIEENGVLLNLKFTAVGAPGSVSPLSFERIMFNEGERVVTVSDGEVQLSN